MNMKQAGQTDLIEFLEVFGHKPIRRNKHIYWYHSPLNEEATPTYRVNRIKNTWIDTASSQEGGIIKLGKLLYRTDNLSDVLHDIEIRKPVIKEIQIAQGSMPTRTILYERIYIAPLTDSALLSFLMSRGMDLHIEQDICVEIQYELYGKHFNAIGIGNIFGGYEFRSPHLKGHIGKKDISLLKTNEGGIGCCIFEDLIDFLSFKTLQDMEIAEFCPYMNFD